MPADLSPISALQSVSAMKVTTGKSFAPQTARDVPKEFEAFVLQSFIQEMLPKNAEGVYGPGIAGDIWRSMMAEKLAFEVAERGGIGIADQVRDTAALKGSQGLGATKDSGAPAPDDPAKSPLVSETVADSAGSAWHTVVDRR